MFGEGAAAALSDLLQFCRNEGNFMAFVGSQRTGGRAIRLMEAPHGGLERG